MTQPFSNKDRFLVLAVAAAALALALFFTRSMTPQFDSVRYANVAHWIAEGEGISTSLTVIPVQGNLPASGKKLSPFTIQPPGLPLFYASTGVEYRAVSHRILHILSYMALAWLVLILGRQLTGRSEVGAVAALLTVLSPALLGTVDHYLADLPTLVFLLGALACLNRSREQTARPVAWLIAASALAACAVAFRLTSLAFGAVLLADLLLHRRRAGKDLPTRLAAGSGIFAAVTLWILVRNQTIVGSLFGTAPRDWPLAPEYGLGRGWSYLGSRLMQSLTPAWGFERVQTRLYEVNAGPETWAVPGLLLAALVILVGAGVVLRRSGRLISWPPATTGAVPGARTLAVVLFAASLLLLLIPAGRHAEFRAIEFRYIVTLLPLLWIAIAALAMSTGRPRIDLSVGVLLVLVFVIGVPGRYQPYTFSRDFLRPGLDWIEAEIPAETAVLTNSGKILLDEDLTRRVYHISDWNFRHALGREMRSQQGFLNYLRRQQIRYVILFGAPNLHKAEYWGRPLIGLFLERWWQPWLAYRDENMKVYRIPPTGPIPVQP